jgi:hypothetical protein
MKNYTDSPARKTTPSKVPEAFKPQATASPPRANLSVLLNDILQD